MSKTCKKQHTSLLAALQKVHNPVTAQPVLTAIAAPHPQRAQPFLRAGMPMSSKEDLETWCLTIMLLPQEGNMP